MVLMLFAVHCTWVTSNAYSSPSIVLASYGHDGYVCACSHFITSENSVVEASSTGWLKIKYPSRHCAISLQPAARFLENSWSCLILTFLRIEQYARYRPHLNYTTPLPCKALTMKITIFTGGFLSASEIHEEGLLLMKTTFSWTLLLNIKMIVFRLPARKRCGQKSPGSRMGEICQPRHALCWCVLWRIRKSAFHSREGKRKWQTLPWKCVTQIGWRLQVSCAIWFHIPAGQSACSHGKVGSTLWFS